VKVTKFNIQSCCGKTAIIFKTDRPLSKNHLAFLVSQGFKETPHFTAAGILYVDNSDFILNGPLGSDRLTVKCKRNEAECTQKINNLEVLLQQVE
jgi:hypothetical protein